MTKTLLSAAIVILLLAGCRQRENTAQLEAINKTLEFSCRTVIDNNRLLCEEMDEKWYDPRARGVAEVWRPRCMRIKAAADSVTLFIDGLKNELLQQSDSLKNSNAATLKNLYKDNGGGYWLINKLMTFKDSIPNFFDLSEFTENQTLFVQLSRGIRFYVENSPILPGYSYSLFGNKKNVYAQKWVDDNFRNCTSSLALVILNKLQNDLLFTENALLQYCNTNATVPTSCAYSVFEAITTLSSTYIKAGQSIKLTAGVGDFSVASKPIVTINGKEVKLTDGAVAEYVFRPAGAPGKHTVPVKIKFYKPNGDTETVIKKLEYTIAE